MKLEGRFSSQTYLSSRDRTNLAKTLGLTETQVSFRPTALGVEKPTYLTFTYWNVCVALARQKAGTACFKKIVDASLVSVRSLP